MKQRQSRGLMPWILTLLCAVLLTVWVLGSMPAAPKEGAAVAAGTAYLDSAAAKDASAIAETLREREKQRRAELLAKQKQEERDALVAKITSGELDIWSMFDSYVILGDSQAPSASITSIFWKRAACWRTAETPSATSPRTWTTSAPCSRTMSTCATV